MEDQKKLIAAYGLVIGAIVGSASRLCSTTIFLRLP